MRYLRLALLAVLTIAVPAGVVRATPGSGVVATPMGSGDLSEGVPILLTQRARANAMTGTDVSKVTVTKFVGEPGASFGWHQHGGPVWAVVTGGALTLYHGDDPTCGPGVYTAGKAFLDPGDHTHIARNEGTVPAEVVAIFMLPTGGEARVDAPDPGVCAF